jgi:spore coat polysaccharide biosynthesis predicted glycosyltransferase SpsG
MPRTDGGAEMGEGHARRFAAYVRCFVELFDGCIFPTNVDGRTTAILWRHRDGCPHQHAAEDMETGIKCKKNDIVLKKATLYEREVIKKQKFFIRRQKLPYSYNMW